MNLTELRRLAAEADEPPYDVEYYNGKAYLRGGKFHAQMADFRLIRGQANARYVAAALTALPALLDVLDLALAQKAAWAKVNHSLETASDESAIAACQAYDAAWDAFDAALATLALDSHPDNNLSLG